MIPTAWWFVCGLIIVAGVEFWLLLKAHQKIGEQDILIESQQETIDIKDRQLQNARNAREGDGLRALDGGKF